MKFKINYPEAESLEIVPLLKAIESIVNSLPKGTWSVEDESDFEYEVPLSRRTPTEEMRYCARSQYYYTRIDGKYHILAKRGYGGYIDDFYQKGLVKTETSTPPVQWVAP